MESLPHTQFSKTVIAADNYSFEYAIFLPHNGLANCSKPRALCMVGIQTVYGKVTIRLTRTIMDATTLGLVPMLA
ncbi:hypothetical protein FOWG_17536 [Fusarium oxysporum f. sp. lycopersici MN25]|nr:hypothetical protein FOWG_17536 [Fusarium oxysporum f. sp. lycopersici MN25]